MPKVTFEQYLDMPEYNNIQTRMLGADSFPYRNVSITIETFNAAVEAIDNAYFVGVQEAYDVSVKLMLRELGVVGNSTRANGESDEPKIVRERDNGGSAAKQKAAILSNPVLMKRIQDLNYWDRHLYRIATERFCATAKKYPDLYAQVQKTKVRCSA